MNIKHIVWDWNGTILNDTEASCKAVDDMLKKRNLETLTIEMYKDKIVFPVITLYNEPGFDFNCETYQEVCNEYLANYLNNSHIISLHKDAEKILELFKNKGLNQHIVSASDSGVLAQQIEKYGIKSYFVNILGQDNNHANSKTFLAEKLVRMVNCYPYEMLFIGDTIHDFEVAQEAGMKCCLVSNGHCSEERLKATGAPVYNNLTELYENYESW
ncbi:MAG: HAD family hydrolase [Clostridiaceae bacterium]|nr:HAD family hydrolase [Clostridiaceae bacterium]